MILPEPAKQPTMYFIGVTTSQSSIMKLFPLWSEELKLAGAIIKGIDIHLHADRETYRKCVAFIKNDPLSLGALVTTHKIDLFRAAEDLFDYIDPYASLFEEVSALSKKENRFEAYAKDPISSGLTIQSFLPDHFWKMRGGQAFILGAGGSALAISSYLADKSHGDDVPSKITISDILQERLDSARKLLNRLETQVEFEFVLVEDPRQNDRILERVPPNSLIVNATGLGKDRPGSPISDEAVFPCDSYVWELNYRGALDFLHQALKQSAQRRLHVEDGWTYFLHGWTQVIAEVFHIQIDNPTFRRLEELAAPFRQNNNKS